MAALGPARAGGGALAALPRAPPAARAPPALPRAGSPRPAAFAAPVARLAAAAVGAAAGAAAAAAACARAARSGRLRRRGSRATARQALAAPRTVAPPFAYISQPPMPDQKFVDAPDTSENWSMVPPDTIRNRIAHSYAKAGRRILVDVGDAVWDYMVLRSQYGQLVRSPFMESQYTTTAKQGKVAVMLFRSENILTEKEKRVVQIGIRKAWQQYWIQTPYEKDHIKAVGIEQFSAACGLRMLLGWLYIDEGVDDTRLESIAHEIGMLVEPGLEDELLSKVSGGVFDDHRRPVPRNSGNFFLALAPLGRAALRLYVHRYFLERPLRDEENIQRVESALRQEELDLAAAGFLRDEATEEEGLLMESARDVNDTYAFAFECLLGHLALNKPYRLHQIISSFGWAMPLPREFLAPEQPLAH